MIEIGVKLQGGRGLHAEGEGSGQGYFPPRGSRVWGGGFAPSQKIFEIFA